LYEIIGREKGRLNLKAIESKKKAAEAKAKQKELIAEKQAKMLARVDELTAQVGFHFV
jgi:hypothetical protein